jgi:hypothetical protein
MAVTRLEMGKTVQSAAQAAGGMDTVGVIEIKPGQRLSNHRDDALDRLLKFRIAGAWEPIGCRVEARVIGDHAPPGSTDGSHRLCPGDADRCFGELSAQDLTTSKPEAANQGVVAGDVAVEGGLAHTQFIRNTGQGDRLDPFAVRDLSRRVDHLFCIESPSRHSLDGIPLLLEGLANAASRLEERRSPQH